MPIVTGATHTVSLSNNPSTATTTYVNIADLLSKKYGKTIRQGQNFQVCGVSVNLTPKGSGYDSGMAVTSKFEYCPTTKHTRRAWNQAHRIWKAQKNLRGEVGSPVKYDEMELEYVDGQNYGRVSSLYQSGMTDSDLDTMSIYSTSSESTNRFGLQDFYNSRNPVGSQSQYGIGGVIKERKYDKFFPDEEEFYATSVLSTNVSEAGEYPSIYLSGAIAQNPMTELPEPANVFCGILQVRHYMIADDTLTQVEDEAYCQITIHVKKWTSLFTPVRRMKRRKSRGRRYNSNYNRGRRYSRRYNRGRRRG